MIERRSLIVAGPALMVAASGLAQRTVPRVAMLWFGPKPTDLNASDEGRFRRRLGELGNVTGTTSMTSDIAGKQLQLLHELVPRAKRIAYLGNPTNAGMAPALDNARAAARNLGVEIGPVVAVTRASDFAAAFNALRTARPDALAVFLEPMIGQNRAQLIAFAADARLPTVYGGGQPVRDGGLISYGLNFSTHYAIAAEYVARILKGAKPGDLPVQQPTAFELVVNLKTAKALGITVPTSVLLQADEVIE